VNEIVCGDQRPPIRGDPLLLPGLRHSGYSGGHVTTIPHWIGGQASPASSTRTSPVFSPATGEQVAQVPLASKDDVAQAVSTAREAAESWNHTSLSKGTKVVNQRRHDSARNITDEHGKVLSDALGEVQRGLKVPQ
jgi:malonate-semialdehyde dehydrogenase (acetylating)/methylmalonate-semialdehyde dehydrogenase